MVITLDARVAEVLATREVRRRGLQRIQWIVNSDEATGALCARLVDAVYGNGSARSVTTEPYAGIDGTKQGHQERAVVRVVAGADKSRRAAGRGADTVPSSTAATLPRHC
jgi:hypothetical protein